MKKVKMLVMGLGSLLMASSALAVENPTTFRMNAGFESSTLFFDCKSPTKNKLHCVLSKTSILQKSKEEIDEELKELDKALLDKKSREEFASNMKQMCLNGKIKPELMKMDIPEISFLPKKIYEESSVNIWQEACRDRNYDNFSLKIKEDAKLKSKVCSVKHYSDEVDFKKVNDDSWISQEGPSGPCGVIVIMKLERNEGSVLWTMRQHRMFTNKAGKLCKDMEDSNSVFSWKYPNKMLMSCEVIEMGSY